MNNFVEDPPFLANVSDSLLRAWAQTVHGYWLQLIRTTNSSVLCSGTSCESSLIPLNHTFVVPGLSSFVTSTEKTADVIVQAADSVNNITGIVFGLLKVFLSHNYTTLSMIRCKISWTS